jgi:hypothetical protein
VERREFVKSSSRQVGVGNGGDGGDGASTLANHQDMNFLQRWTFLQLQKRVDHLLAVVEDRPQLLPAAIARSNDVSQRNRIAGQLRPSRPRYS